jgi:membrane fusion protein (multidrug efflux system)
MKIKLVYDLPIILVIGLIFGGCGNSSNKTNQLQPEEYPVTEVFIKDVNIPLEFVTSIQAVQNVEIRARVPGYLENIYADEGTLVKHGQLLFKINDEEYQAEVDRAKASIASAEAETKTAMVELERVKLLVDKKVVAQTELDLAEAKLEIARSKIKVAQAEETTAEIKLANTSIRSPFTGIINNLPLKRGSLISEGLLLTTISDISYVYTYFNVSEVEYLKFNRANVREDTLFLNNVELLLADGSTYPLKGKVDAVQGEFEAGTGTLVVRAKFKNPKFTLKHGSTGKLRLLEVQGNSLLIPQKSVLEIQDKNYVLLLDKNNVVMMKSFVPLRRIGDFYIVSKGLNEHDVIVYEGIQNVKEGMVIKPLNVSTEELLKSNKLFQE